MITKNRVDGLNFLSDILYGRISIPADFIVFLFDVFLENCLLLSSNLPEISEHLFSILFLKRESLDVYLNSLSYY